MVHGFDSCRCLVAKQATLSSAKRKLASFDTGSAKCQRGSWGVQHALLLFQLWLEKSGRSCCVDPRSQHRDKVVVQLEQDASGRFESDQGQISSAVFPSLGSY